MRIIRQKVAGLCSGKPACPRFNDAEIRRQCPLRRREAHWFTAPGQERASQGGRMPGPIRSIVAATTVSLAMLAIGFPAAAQGVSFKGKTITMLTGDDPGGGTDISGRLIALYLHKY